MQKLLSSLLIIPLNYSLTTNSGRRRRLLRCLQSSISSRQGREVRRAQDIAVSYSGAFAGASSIEPSPAVSCGFGPASTPPSVALVPPLRPPVALVPPSPVALVSPPPRTSDGSAPGDHRVVDVYQEAGCDAAAEKRRADELVACLRGYSDEMRRMQNIAHEHSRRIFEENQNLRSLLDSKRKELDLRSKQLDIIRNDVKTRKLDDEKLKNALATLEQEKADENVLRLVEEQKRETEEGHNKILQLEKQLDEKQKLELEIQQIKGKLEVMKCIKGGDEDLAAKVKMEQMSEELKEKIEEMDLLEALNNTLVVKEHTSNN